MPRLNAQAKEALRWAGITQVAWAREHCGGDRRYGDACGCPDDRCIGFHHVRATDCHCLPALIGEYLLARKAVAK